MVDALDDLLQPNIATTQMDLFWHREPKRDIRRARVMINYWGEISRHDDAVACFVFGNALVDSVSKTEGYIVWKFMALNARFRCGSICGRDRKRTKHLLGRREVGGDF